MAKTDWLGFVPVSLISRRTNGDQPSLYLQLDRYIDAKFMLLLLLVVYRPLALLVHITVH